MRSKTKRKMYFTLYLLEMPPKKSQKLNERKKRTKKYKKRMEGGSKRRGRGKQKSRPCCVAYLRCRPRVQRTRLAHLSAFVAAGPHPVAGAASTCHKLQLEPGCDSRCFRPGNAPKKNAKNYSCFIFFRYFFAVLSIAHKLKPEPRV